MSDTALSRRDQILQCLAQMLEESPGQRITTAVLAKKVGVSEAALYRHFPSKARMFEGLIEFIEQTLFSRINLITQSEATPLEQLEQIIRLILMFSEKNPGISRILSGDALVGENERLSKEINNLFDRIELQLKQVMRLGELQAGLRTHLPVGVTANLLLAITEGRIRQFVRSNFRKSPDTLWQEQWAQLAVGLFFTKPV